DGATTKVYAGYREFRSRYWISGAALATCVAIL
ncbi:hypothetical protein M513_04199, partial [Trichuris suis]